MAKERTALVTPYRASVIKCVYAIMLVISAGGLDGCGASSNFSNIQDNGSFAPTPAAEHTAALSQAADKLTSGATPGNSAYKIGPLDVLDVSVFQVPDLTRSVQVADNGTINYPLVGQIQAAGKTAHQVETELTSRLSAKYLQSPQVTVFVKEFNSQRFTVEGSVRHTGVFPLKGQTTLVQALAEAGDIDKDVASGAVVIFRTINGKRCAARFDFDAVQGGKTEDPQLQPGDVVVVDTSPGKVALQGFLRVLPIAGTAAAFAPL
jgi:polysaccharide biosynthesis/export protein